MLKKDELFAKEALEQYYRNASMDVVIEEGDNPPDLVVIYNGRHIPLEVTRAENICIGKNGLANRRTIDTSLTYLSNAINQEYGTYIPSDKTLLIYVQGPAPDGSRFSRSLRNFIRSIVTDTSQLKSLANTPIESIVEGVPLELKLIITSPQRKRIVGVIGNRDAIINIVREATLVLNDRIRDKERKVQAFDGEKWLVILNCLALASTGNFVEAFSQISAKHSFSRIYLIGDGEVTELYPINKRHP